MGAGLSSPGTCSPSWLAHLLTEQPLFFFSWCTLHILTHHNSSLPDIIHTVRQQLMNMQLWLRNRTRALAPRCSAQCSVMAALSPSLLFVLGLVSTVSGYLHIYPPVDENDTRTPLHFALLQSFGSEYNGSGSVAGLQVALDRINSDPTLLPGYTLHYTLTDSQVKHCVGLSDLLQLFTVRRLRRRRSFACKKYICVVSKYIQSGQFSCVVMGGHKCFW